MSTERSPIVVVLAIGGLLLCAGLGGAAAMWFIGGRTVSPSGTGAEGGTSTPAETSPLVLATTPEEILGSMVDLDPDQDQGNSFVLGRAVQMAGFSQVRFDHQQLGQRLFLVDVVASDLDRVSLLRLFKGDTNVPTVSLARCLGYANLELGSSDEVALDRKIAPVITYRWATLSAHGNGSALWLRCEGRPELLLLYGDADGESYDHTETLAFAERVHWCR